MDGTVDGDLNGDLNGDAGAMAPPWMPAPIMAALTPNLGGGWVAVALDRRFVREKG